VKNLLAVAAVLAATWCVGLARAQDPVRIDSVGGIDTRIPIAVPPFPTDAAMTAWGAKLSAVMANDLEFTGLFTIVPPSKYPPTFRGLPGEPAKIDFEAWRNTPAEHLMYAIITREPSGHVVAECRLFDVLVSQQVVGKRLRTQEKWTRLLAHQFADESVRFMTGVAGIASSEIVFSGKSGKAKEIFVADYDGGTVTQVTHHGSISIKPKISPDGTKIAYLSYKDRYPFLYIYDRLTGKSVPLSRRVGLNHAPAWAPDGKQLALCLSKDGNTEIYLKNADGTGERRLTRDRGSDTSPVFSPDGRQIAFVSDRAGRAHIYVMNADGSNVRRLSYQGGSSYDPAWSPDGKYIAYVVEKSGEGFEVYVMNSDGSGSRALTSSRGYNESPSWSPDSRHVVFASSRAGNSQLYTVTLETGVVRKIQNLERLSCEGPSWGPRRN